MSGYLTVLVLVFGSIFTIVVAAFIGYIVSQNQVVNFRYEQQRATDIAEAGLNYYRWYLAHYPGDITNGTTTPGPYVHEYRDPEGGVIGEFSLAIASSTYCGEVTAIDIASTGHTYANPDARSTVRGRYARESVASYYFITNSSVWYNSAGVVNGQIHSNQGVRMDKAHNSVVTSGLTDWSCGSSYGCSPTTTVNGVFTTQPLVATPALFSFPAAPIDFAGISLNLVSIQDKAQNAGGIYVPASTREGYQLIFKGDRVEIREVRQKENEPNGKAWGWYMNKIKQTTFVAEEVIDPACPVIFVEDLAWIQGYVNGKVTLAVADVDTPGEDPSVILNDNITYGTADAGLLVVAEKDVSIGFEGPENSVFNGIFVAQSGRFGRDNYADGNKIPAAWRSYIIRDSLTLNGTIISASRSGYNYGSPLVSGFTTVTSTYDTNQVYDPPPFTPYTSEVYQFFNWRQDG